MKNILCLLVLPFLGFSQITHPEQRIETPIKAVTLYLDGAEINQEKTVNLNAGITSVVFYNLSSKLIPKSIQVNVSEGVSVLSVSQKLNFLNVGKDDVVIKKIKDSLNENQSKTELLAFEKEAYVKEKELLEKNSSIGGTDKGVSISELKLAADFYRARIKEINLELFKFDTKIKEQNITANRLRRELRELNSQENKPTGEIIILLQSDLKVAANIDLKYVVSDAGWAPYYELKAEDITKPISLVYRARAFNNAGVDWTNVKIKLSTADPTRSASKPSVDPWFLNFSNGQIGYAKRGSYNSDRFLVENAPKESQLSQINSSNLENLADKSKLSEVEQSSWNAYESGLKRKMDTKVTYEEVQVSELSVEFEIKKNYSIPADAKPYILEVTTYTLDASFKHYAIPKIEKDAYLLARITGWEDLDLIEGPANVYFGGTFIGQSYIDPRSVNDTLDLSFGRENKVIVTRTKIKDYNKENFIGSSRKVVYAYQILIKNNRKNAINIDLEDQIPISQNSEITVDAIELSKGEVNKDDGKVNWKFLIPPGESQKIIFSYSIKYPKNRNIDTERKQKKYRAKF